MDNEQLSKLTAEADELFGHGRFDEALEAYRAILEQDNTVAWAHSRIGAVMAQRGDLGAAEAALTQALALNPKLPQANSNLGNVYYQRGLFDKAAECYQTATKLDPTNPVYFENLHAALKRQGKISEAVKALKQSHKVARDVSNQQTKEEFQKVKRKVGCASTVMIALALLVGLGVLIAVLV